MGSRFAAAVVLWVILCGSLAAQSIQSIGPAGVTPAALSAAIAQMQAALPQAATAAPPSVGDANAAGTLTTQYALANHTHASSVYKKIAVTAADGTATVSFPAGQYALAPTCQVTPEATSGQPYTALVTARSATQVTVQVLRAQTLPASIAVVTALASFNIFGGSVGAGVTVHVMCAKESTN